MRIVCPPANQFIVVHLRNNMVGTKGLGIFIQLLTETDRHPFPMTGAINNGISRNEKRTDLFGLCDDLILFSIDQCYGALQIFFKIRRQKTIMRKNKKKLRKGITETGSWRHSTR